MRRNTKLLCYRF